MKIAWYNDIDDDNIFDLSSPDEWWEGCEPKERYEIAPDEPILELTDEGEELFLKWKDDDACGYSLGHGRMKGLAATYNKYQIWNKIKNDRELSHEYQPQYCF